jgi:hypothetical protein
MKWKNSYYKNISFLLIVMFLFALKGRAPNDGNIGGIVADILFLGGLPTLSAYLFYLGDREQKNDK